jgi:hypothetical protein
MHRLSTALILSGSLAAFACQPDQGQVLSTGGSGGGGGKASGGATGSGGSSARGGSGGGGSTNTGGSTSGGSSGSGGASGGSGGGGSPEMGGRSGRGGSGSGGSSSAGGSEGSGGSTGRGGSTGGGKGGATGAGGSSSTGGSPGSGGTTTTSTSTTSCTFTQQATLSTKIGTVGIVTWSTTLANPTEANIDFGLTTSYGYTAPVDLKAKDYRTLLLGMKPTKTYNYRIRAKNSSGECTSQNYTLTSGSLPSGLTKITVSNKSTASPLYGGFLITGQYAGGGGSSGAPAYILDADNEFVWAYAPGRDVTGARMDYTGTHMWINSANVPNGSTSVHRVTMDGLTDEDLSSKFTGLNHQLTVFSADGTKETVAFYAYGSSCDDIKEYDTSSGTVKTIVNSGKAKGESSACHCNNIQYSKEDDTLVFSELDSQVLVKVKRSDGSTVWVLNGTSSGAFTGDTWKGGNHGIHILGLDRLLFFNNNSKVNMGGMGAGGGDGTGSIAVELKLDLTGKKMTKAWSYKASPGIDNAVMGDVQRLPNGNTIVAYSTKGVLHEVSSSGTLLQELSWPAGGQFGYIEKRASLYGPPPK